MNPITQINQGMGPAQTAAPQVPGSSKASGLISPNKIYQTQSGQNLAETTRVANFSDTPSGSWKSMVPDVCALASAGLFGYSFARYLAGGFSFWFVFAALLFWGAISTLEGFLQKSAQRRFLVIFFESLAIVGFFYDYAWQALAIAAIAIIGCLLWGYFSVRRALWNSVEIRFFTASGRVMGKVVTAAVVFMVIMYASLVNNRGNFFVSQNGFDTFFNWAAGFVNNFYPTVPLTGSVGDFAQAVARMQLQGNPDFRSLSPSQQNATLAQSANHIISVLSTGASTSTAVGSSSTAAAPVSPALPSEPTSDAFYNYFSDLAANLQDKFNTIFISAWGLALFLILRSIGIIVVWLGQFVSLVFYEILLATGFMKISEQSATKESVEY